MADQVVYTHARTLTAGAALVAPGQAVGVAPTATGTVTLLFSDGTEYPVAATAGIHGQFDGLAIAGVKSGGAAAVVTILS
ncbi:hypothetical protein [uncultured Methylobacterium sp.]|uniref:hypothetical protein n=1 Tax=uncultured Methylobacterium sp. TaxID=157278 RepID=UPI0035CAD164